MHHGAVVHSKQEIPDMLLGSHDLHVLTDILHPYTIYVQQLFSSGQAGIRGAEITSLRSRFFHVFRSSDQPLILLTSRECEIITLACDLFLQTIPRIVTPSEEREATLQTCRVMQHFFRKQLLYRYQKEVVPMSHYDTKES